MSNTSFRKGFKQYNAQNVRLTQMTLKASYTGLDGDVIYAGSDGYPTQTRNSAYPIIGCQQGNIIDKDDLTEKTTAADGDFITLTDPSKEHWGEIATGARTDIYTTFASGSEFDVAGASGAMYILQSSSTYDQVKILGPAKEVSGPNQGQMSEFGSNQKVVFKFTDSKIMRVVSNYYQKY